MKLSSATRCRRGLGIVSMLVLALLVFTSTSEAATKLRWKFKPGEQTRYDIKMDMGQEMTVGDMPIKTQMSQVMSVLWDVKEVDAEGNGKLEQTIERVQVEMLPGVPGAPAIKYDSDNKEPEPGAEVFATSFKAMIGHPFKMTVSPLGEVKDITLPPDMMAGLAKANPAMGAMFSEESMKEMMSRSFFSFPAEVEQGKSWDVNVDMTNPVLGKQTVATQYTYVGPEKHDGQDIEKVDLNVEIKFELDPKNPAKVEVKEQSGKGAIYFDNKLGLPIETDVTSDMKMVISLGGMTLESQVTSKTAMKKAPEKKAPVKK